MFERTAPVHLLTDWSARLDAITRAYDEGDAPYGERLFTQALDDGVPWDQTCAAVARGIARHYQSA